MYIDPVYLCVFGITMLLSMAAQLYVTSAYKRWSQVRNSLGMNGAEVGQAIVSRTQLGAYLARQGAPVRFVGTPGQLTDHYDPRTNTVALSQGVATQPSVASMAIVAHELGHAQQDATNSTLMAVRNFLVPAVTFSPQISYFCILLGLLFNILGLVWVGVIFFGLTVLFALLTVPVEMDASRRAIKLLSNAGLMQSEKDSQGARQVLNAAAATYLAAAVSAILQLLYYISFARRRS